MANSNLGRLKDTTKLLTGSVRRGDRFDTYQFRLNDRSSLNGTLGSLKGGNADLELFNGSIVNALPNPLHPGATLLLKPLMREFIFCGSNNAAALTSVIASA